MVKNNRMQWTAFTEHILIFDCGKELVCPMSRQEGIGKQQIPERAKVRMRLHAETCGCNAHDVYLLRDAIVPEKKQKWGVSAMAKEAKKPDSNVSIVQRNGRAFHRAESKSEYIPPNPISITFIRDGGELQCYDYYPEPKENNKKDRERITNEFQAVAEMKNTVMKLAVEIVKQKQRRMIEERIATARFLMERKERLRGYIEETGETIVFKGFDNM